MSQSLQTDVIGLVSSPLVFQGNNSCVRLVLAECAAYGMPPQVLATLDDVFAMLGLYDPLPANQAAHLGGPLVQWRQDPKQPVYERVDDVERLAFKQRALMAFGGGIPGHLVGTAEIVAAIGNCTAFHVPDDWFQVYAWASVDVQHQITHQDKADIFSDYKWEPVSDDDVLKPTGKYNAVYVTMATEIRRQVISALESEPTQPRRSVRYIGEHLLKQMTRWLQQANAEGDTATINRIERQIRNIQRMHPDLPSELAA